MPTTEFSRIVPSPGPATLADCVHPQPPPLRGVPPAGLTRTRQLLQDCGLARPGCELELRLLGAAFEGEGGRGAPRDHGGHLIEVSGSDLALVAGGGVAEGLHRQFAPAAARRRPSCRRTRRCAPTRRPRR